MVARMVWIGMVLGAALPGCGPGHEGTDADAGPDADAPDADLPDADPDQVGPCPDDMALIDDGLGTPFCIERYEYPGVAGEQPQPNMAWYQAAAACVERRRELCLGDQWARACAGTPAEACEGPIAASGARPGCVSTAGVYDLPGNMAEWTADIGIDVAYVVAGGAGEGDADAGPAGEIGCDAREEFNAELHRVFLGFRCCARARLEH
jgi:formylglycine-generating enzyme required for sulfatase activity